MEELVSYLTNHQETTRFPDREAKQIRNHPYMTQLDFFDMQDEQQKAWEEQNRKERQKQVALEAGTSLALEDAAGNRRRRPQLAIEDATGGNADDDEVEEISRSEVGTMQGQRDDRSSAMALAVRQQLGGLQSNPGTDVPRPILRLPIEKRDNIPRSLIYGTNWQRPPTPSRGEMRAYPAWHNRTEQQQYDSGGKTWRHFRDIGYQENLRQRELQHAAMNADFEMSPESRIWMPDASPPGVRYGPPNRSLALRAIDKSASYGSMALGKIWDAIRIHPLDPDPVRNRELWAEIRAEQAARRDEALYAAIDRENATNIQAIMDQAARQPQRGWYEYMLGNEDNDEAGQPEEPDNTWGDWSSITNPKPRPLGPPPLPPSSSSGADWTDLPPAPPPKRKRDTQEENERKWKAEQSAAAKRWDRQVAKEDRMLKRGFR
jgi:hypothetical protein